MMQLEGATEENVLTMLCWDETHAPGLVLRVEAGMFSTRAYRKIAETAFAYLAKFGRPPQAHLRDLLEAPLRKGEEGRLLNDTIKQMEALAPKLQPAYVMETLHDFVELRTMNMALERASEALANGDKDAARGHLTQANMPTIGHNSGGIWLHDEDSALKWLDREDMEQFSCGIDTLDDREVRLARKTMTVFVAPPKRGKSWWLVTVGRRAMMRGKRVLHVTLENSEELTAQRYIQSMLAMTKRQGREVRSAFFKKDELGRATSLDFHVREPEGLLDVGRARLAREIKKFKNRAPFLIKEFPTGTLTVAKLNGYLDFLDKVQNFRPDLLIVDYPNLMLQDGKNLRISLGQTFMQLRGIAVQRNLALATVTQGSKASMTAKIVTEGHVAEDFSIIGTADTVLTYMQTATEKRLGLARVLVANAREAEDKYMVMLSQSYATGQFCLDDVFMTHVLEDEMRRYDGDATEEEDD